MRGFWSLPAAPERPPDGAPEQTARSTSFLFPQLFPAAGPRSGLETRRLGPASFPLGFPGFRSGQALGAA